MEITESARKHGISDVAIQHAWEFAMRVRLFEHDGEERRLIIGPDESGVLLELVALVAPGADVIIHADRLRPKFYDYL